MNHRRLLQLKTLMNNASQEENVRLEPNSKPYLIKRLIADAFDILVVFILFMTLSNVLLSTPLANTYNEHYGNYKEIERNVIEQYGNDINEIGTEEKKAISETLNNDQHYLDERFAANLHSYLLKLLAGFIAEAVVFLIIPLILKTRGTLGKLLMKIMPFCERKQTRATIPSIIGKFAFVFIIDSAFLYLFTGIYTFILVPVIRLIEMLLNKKNKTICDALSGVTIIERLSYNGIYKF